MDDSTRRLRQLIIDLDAPRYSRTFSTLTNYNDLKKDLNEDQINAFELALKAEDYALILGMPGTGKTFTIAQIIKALYVEVINNNKFESLDEFTEFIESRRVVATTCLANEYPIFTKRRFDYCIIDEATQITLPTCIGPLRFGRPIPSSCDHNQLQPLVLRTEAIKKGMEKEFIQNLYRNSSNAVANLRYAI
ncbi:unnamed protein product [Rhizophagus irregularis]|nr:unnamed protein product [Rhizophagus irregularis]